MAWKSGQSYSADLRRGCWRRSTAAARPGRWRSGSRSACPTSTRRWRGARHRRDRGAAAAQPPGAEAGGASCGDRGRGGAPAGRDPGGAAGLAAGDAWRVRQPRADAQHPGPAGADAQKKTGRAEEQDRPDVAEQRADWRAKQGGMSRRGWCSSTRPGRRPTWRGATAAARAAGAWMARSRTATGRGPPSSAASPRAASSPPMSSTAP